MRKSTLSTVYNSASSKQHSFLYIMLVQIYYRRIVYLFIMAPASKLCLIGFGFLVIDENYADRRKLRLKANNRRGGGGSSSGTDGIFGKGVKAGDIIVSNHTSFIEVSMSGSRVWRMMIDVTHIVGFFLLLCFAYWWLL